MTPLLDVKARCDNEANDNSLCFDAKTPAAVCSVDTGAPVWCRRSEKPFLAGLAFLEGGCISMGMSGIRIAFYEQWIRRVLDAVDCGNPYTIKDGTIDLVVQGKSTFSAKASVTCKEEYRPSLKHISCGQDGQWTSARCDRISGNDCWQLRNEGITTSGTYLVDLWMTAIQIQVYCDMETDGGGWTVFQNRFDGSVDFNKNLAEYEDGFGDLGGEFWTGLRYVQEMALLGTTELRVDVARANLTQTFYSVYQNFHLGSDNRYELNIGTRSGSDIPYPVNSGDSTLNIANGSCFSTPDRDCDSMPTASFSNLYKAGWWFPADDFVVLNGMYLTPGTEMNYKGIIHYGFNQWKSLSASKMMFRRVQL